MRLQAAADRAASKHFGDSCSRDKAGLSADPAEDSTAGHALYKHRRATVEPVFAQIKFNRKINRFQRRRRAAALSEWRLVAATHNLLKLHSHWIAAETA